MHEQTPETSTETKPENLPELKLLMPGVSGAYIGLSGWLILVGLRLAFAPVALLVALFRVYLPIFFQHNSRVYLGGHPWLLAAASFEILSNVVMVMFLVALNLLFYQKKKAFQLGFVTYMALQVIQVCIDHLLVLLDAPRPFPAASISVILSAAVWITYMLVSTRVKNTFVN